MLFGPREKEILGLNDLPLVGAQVLLYTFLSMSILFPDLLLSGRYWLYFLQWLEIFSHIVLYILVSRYLYIYLAKKYPGYDNWRKRLPRLPLVLLSYGFVAIFLHFTLQRLINIEISGYIEDRVIKEITIGVFFALFGIGVYESLYLFVQLKEDQIKLKSIEKQKVQNQLDVLKHQLSPHFLFNCFNSLSHLIDENRDKGKIFVNHLSDVHRKILEFSERDVITLGEELELTTAYVDLLKTRFGEKLQFKINIYDRLLTKKIVPLAIQIAIENAVKHNTITDKNPLTIFIQSNGEYLEIKNGNLPKSMGFSTIGTGLGLQNIKDRYELLTYKKVLIEKSNSTFVLKLPVLESDHLQNEVSYP